MREDALPLARPCALAGVNRATYYAHQRATPMDDEEGLMLHLIDEEYTPIRFLAVGGGCGFCGTEGSWSTASGCND